MVREVKIGKLAVGGKHPVRIKGMLKSSVAEAKKIIKEAKLLEAEGAEAIRVAVQNDKDTRIKKTLGKVIKAPLVADIHFHYKLALRAIDCGFDGIRLNPLNIYKKEEVKEVVRAAKDAKISIRIGVNSGGFKKKFPSDCALAKEMVKRVADYLRLFEKENFFDIIVSLKASSPQATILANRIFAKKFDYPLHLGVTATGLSLEGLVKSSIAIGTLLREGIGNIIRVSLTAPSIFEIRAAKAILEAINLRSFGPQIISCPTCSRCQVDLIKIVENFKEHLETKKFTKPLTVALMGCVVNGPGEAYQADIGAAFGRKKCAIFRKDKILGYSDRKNIVNDLFKQVKRITK